MTQPIHRPEFSQYMYSSKMFFAHFAGNGTASARYDSTATVLACVYDAID